ncbi:hypothetical protein ACVWYN_000412 [Pedobacter sp. UYP24]
MKIRITSILLFIAIILNIALLLKISDQKSVIFKIRKQKELEVNRESSAVKFDKYTHDFAHIPHGQPVKTSFTFTNKSVKAIKIANVVSSCGCTTSQWDSSVNSGSKGNVELSFDALAIGPFNKEVRVYVNGEEKPIKLTIEGIVK